MDEAGWNTPRSSRRRRRRRKHKSALKEGRNNVASQSTQHIFVKTSRSTKFSAEDANEILAKDDDLREYCKRLWGFNRNRWPQVQFWPVLLGPILDASLNKKPWPLRAIQTGMSDWRATLIEKLEGAEQMDLRRLQQFKILVLSFSLPASPFNF